MPALNVFGRRWLVAGDDLPGPALFLATFHLIWVALLCAWLGEINGPDNCQGVGPYYVAVGGLTASFALSFLLEIAIAVVGLRGSLFETQKRASLPRLIYVNAASMISQIAFNIYASYLVTQKPPQCTGQGGKPFNPVDVLHGCVWSTWAIIFGVLVFIITAYNLFPDYKDPEEWEKQCECLALTCFCCPGSIAPTSMASPFTFHKNRNHRGGGGGDGTSDSASSGHGSAIPRRLGAIFFLMFGHIDFTPTDCIVAFGLAMNRQEIRKKALFAAMSRNSRSSKSSGGDSSERGEYKKGSGGGGGSSSSRSSSSSGRGAAAKEMIRKLNKTMGGISRAASAVRGFRTTGAASVATAGGGGGGLSSSAGKDETRSPASVDGLLSDLEMMETGGIGVATNENGGGIGVGEGRGDESSNKKGIVPLEEEIEFHPQFSHSSFSKVEQKIDLGRLSSRAGAAALRRKRSVEPPFQGAASTAPPAAAEASATAAGNINGATSSSPYLDASPTLGATAEGQTELEIEQENIDDGNGNDEKDGEQGALGLPKPLRMKPADAETLQEAAYYMKYAFAAYGWMLLVYSRKTTGLFKLCCGRGFGLLSSIASRKHGVLPFANPLQAPYFNTEAILQAAELTHEEDLVSVRLEAEVQNVLPYYIAIDHVKKVVVLAIRGSLSMEDVVRDLLFEPADLDLWVEEKRAGGWDAPLPHLTPATETTRYAAHSGIFEAARATLADIQSSGVLASLLLGPSKRLPDYTLVCCGHSLGAGVAFLLSLRMRQFFPGLKCWAFSPPGGLATAELSAGAVEWCTSVVCGKEMIPRLTLATFERARDEMVYCAARCRVNKSLIFLSWLSGKVFTEKELFYAADDVPAEPQSWLESYRKSLGSTSAKREYVELATKFGPPGKCLYLKPSGTRAQGEKSYFGGFLNPFHHKKPVVRDYKGVWVDGEALVDQGIVISGRMMLDHFPDFCLAVLQRLAAAGGHGAAAHVSDAAGESEVRNRLHTPSSPRTAAFEVE